MNIFLTGGMGYIGSHTAVVLLQLGYNVTIFDNLSNSNKSVLNRIEQITGKCPDFIEGDIRDKSSLVRSLKLSQADTVIHFAGLKSVGESVVKPIEYYDNNVVGTIQLLKAMKDANVCNLIFSSSATVYGIPQALPISEDCPTQNATNPYGRSKLQIEEILHDYSIANKDISVVCLRYFNPIGAHESGLLGEDPKGIPNNLMPYIMKVAAGELPCLGVFGDDYDTPDGSCIRDFINVVDLAKAHVIAIRRILEKKQKETVEVFNIGTGRGLSVLELINAFEKATGVKLNYQIVGRRAGDIEKVWADPKFANEELGWKAVETIEDTLRSAWNWQLKLRERGIQ